MIWALNLMRDKFIKIFYRLNCLVGFHTTERIESEMDHNCPLPVRECTKCKQRQGLFRGLGGDEWINIPSPKKNQK